MIFRWFHGHAINWLLMTIWVVPKETCYQSSSILPRMHPPSCHRLTAKCWGIKKHYCKLVLRQANFYLEMAMGTNLLGLAIPNLCPWKQPKPIFFKKHTHDGHKILPKPEPVRLTGYSRVTRARQQPYIVAPLPCWQLVNGQCIHVLHMMNHASI